LLLLTSCAPPRSSRIVIGAKNFTEQVVLGEHIFSRRPIEFTGCSRGAGCQEEIGIF